MSSVAYGSLQFKEQIAFFRAKQNVLTERWTDLWQAEHDHGFMVAGVNRMDMLIDFRQAVDNAIANGHTLEDFRQDFDRIVAKYGWQYNGGRNWRSRVIYETNMRTSYAAGRYAQLQRLKSVRPYWRYRHSDAVQHPRPLHLAWNGLVLHADDPWWHTHYPPNGWGCQCTIEALNSRDLGRMGKDGPDAAPADDMHTVTVGKRGPAPFDVQVPAGIDPGFGYAPGASANEQLAQTALSKAEQLPAEAGARMLQDMLALPSTRRELDATWQTFRDTAAPADTVKTGALSPDLVSAVTAAGQAPAVAPISADTTVLAPLRPGALAPLTAADLAQLPSRMAHARVVLLNTASGRLIYVLNPVPGADKRLLMVSVELGHQGNRIKGSARLSADQLHSQITSGGLVVLQGRL